MAELLAAAYLVPEPLPVQSDDDHGGVGEEALAVERQISPFPRHVHHVPATHTVKGKRRAPSRNFQFYITEESAYPCKQRNTRHHRFLIKKPKAPPGGVFNLMSGTGSSSSGDDSGR